MSLAISERLRRDVADRAYHVCVGQPPKSVQLFHPRTDRWAEHFQLFGARIEPVNIVGEATVKLLQLNHDTRLREREILALAGRYPTIEALARMKE